YPLLRFFETTSTVRLGVSHEDVDLVTRLVANLRTSAGWLWTYWTPPLAVLALVALVPGPSSRPRPAWLLALLVAVPVLAFSAVSPLWFPRYLLFISVPLLVLAAGGLVRLRDSRGLGSERAPRRGLLAAGALLVLVFALRIDRDLWTDPARAALPDVEREQFVFGWPSGYASRDTVAFVRDELGRHPDGVLVVSHTHSRRTTWHALGLAFAGDPRVELRDLDLGNPQALDLLAAWARVRPTIVVVSPVGPARPPPPPEAWAHLGGLAARFCKPDGELCDEVYRLDRAPASAGLP